MEVRQRLRSRRLGVRKLGAAGWANRIFDLPRELHRRFSVLMKQPIVPIQQRRVDISDGLAAVLDRALARNPQQRYPSVAAFRAALTAAGPSTS